MTTENKPLTLAKKLSNLQYNLKAPKDTRNEFGKYNYRTADAILSAFKSTAQDNDYNLFITIKTNVSSVNNNLFIEAIATIHDADTKETIDANAFAMHPFNQKGMSESQITGSAITYAKKYALCNLLAIDDSKDDPDTTFNSLLNSVQGAKDLDTLNEIKNQLNGLKPNEKTAITSAIQEKISKHTKHIKPEIEKATTPEELVVIYKTHIANNLFLTSEAKQALSKLCGERKQALLDNATTAEDPA